MEQHGSHHPHLILRVVPGRKQQGEGMGSVRDEIRNRLALAEKGYLEQLLEGTIEDQEKQKLLERRSEGPDETDTESGRLLRGRRRQQTEDNCVQRPDSSEAPNSSHQRKRRLMRLSSSTKRVVKPGDGRMVCLRKPHTG